MTGRGQNPQPSGPSDWTPASSSQCKCMLPSPKVCRQPFFGFIDFGKLPPPLLPAGSTERGYLADDSSSLLGAAPNPHPLYQHDTNPLRSSSYYLQPFNPNLNLDLLYARNQQGVQAQEVQSQAGCYFPGNTPPRYSYGPEIRPFDPSHSTNAFASFSSSVGFPVAAIDASSSGQQPLPQPLPMIIGQVPRPPVTVPAVPLADSSAACPNSTPSHNRTQVFSPTCNYGRLSPTMPVHPPIKPEFYADVLPEVKPLVFQHYDTQTLKEKGKETRSRSARRRKGVRTALNTESVHHEESASSTEPRTVVSCKKAKKPDKNLTQEKKLLACPFMKRGKISGAKGGLVQACHYPGFTDPSRLK